MPAPANTRRKMTFVAGGSLSPHTIPSCPMPVSATSSPPPAPQTAYTSSPWFSKWRSSPVHPMTWPCTLMPSRLVRIATTFRNVMLTCGEPSGGIALQKAVSDATPSTKSLRRTFSMSTLDTPLPVRA